MHKYQAPNKINYKNQENKTTMKRKLISPNIIQMIELIYKEYEHVL